MSFFLHEAGKQVIILSRLPPSCELLALGDDGELRCVLRLCTLLEFNWGFFGFEHNENGGTCREL